MSTWQALCGERVQGRTEKPLRPAGRRGRSKARYLRRLLFRRAELDHLSPLLRGNPLHAFAKVNGYIKLNYLRHNLFLPFVFCDFVLHRRYAGLSLMRGPATPIRTGSRPSHTNAAFSEVPYTPRMTSSTWLFSITLATSVGRADRFWDATGLSFECQTIVRNSPFDAPISIVPVGARPFHLGAVRSYRRGKAGASDGRVKSMASWVDCFFNRFVGRRRQKA